jgi:hypothetical protein
LDVAAFQVFGGLVALMNMRLAGYPGSIALAVLFAACAAFFLVWTIILTASKKIKWRGRELLELAAASVEKVGNGYTPRPLPAGKTDFNQRQILDFCEFARRNLIAVPYLGKDKAVLVPVKEGCEYAFILGLKADYTDETWVSIDFDGNVSVNISHRDYLEYKESLAFDQLCESLGNVFVDFIRTYLRGEGGRVVDRLNSVGVPYFS